MKPIEYLSRNPQDTMRFAGRLIRHLRAGDILLLKGELGAGKTTFVKGLAQGLKVKPDDICSPTFVLMNEYQGKIPLYHFDLYRLDNAQALSSVHFDEYFYGDGIAVVEWPQRLGEMIPEEYFQILFEHKNETERKLVVSASGKLPVARFGEMAKLI